MSCAMLAAFAMASRVARVGLDDDLRRPSSSSSSSFSSLFLLANEVDGRTSLEALESSLCSLWGTAWLKAKPL